MTVVVVPKYGPSKKSSAGETETSVGKRKIPYIIISPLRLDIIIIIIYSPDCVELHSLAFFPSLEFQILVYDITYYTTAYTSGPRLQMTCTCL